MTDSLYLSEIIHAVRAHLTPDLLLPEFRKTWSKANPTAGFCSVASEAAFFLLGGGPAGWKAQTARDSDGIVHWWLAHDSGLLLDLTADQYTARGMPVPYASGKGRGGGFQGMRTDPDSPWGFGRRPSARAAVLLERIARPLALDLDPVFGIPPEPVAFFLKRAMGAQRSPFIPVGVLEMALKPDQEKVFSYLITLPAGKAPPFLQTWMRSLQEEQWQFLNNGLHETVLGLSLVEDLMAADYGFTAGDVTACRKTATALQKKNWGQAAVMASELDTLAARLDAALLSRTMPAASRPAPFKAKL
jgi:hypothetical protein